MQRITNGSHLPGRDIIILEGLDRAKVLHNSTLNFQESFTFSILFQLTNPYRLDFAILTKGLLDTVGQGKLGVESVAGKLRVWLHDVNNTKSLAVETVNNIVNTNEVFHLVITWNYTAKELKIYKNAVEQSYVLLSGSDKHSSVSQMGQLRNNTDDLWIGAATGKNGAKIKMLGHLALVQRVWSSTEVLSVYNTIKYTGAYPNQPKIVFSSKRGVDNYYSLYTMNEDGTNQQLLKNEGTHLISPRWSLSGNYISCLRMTGGAMSHPNYRTGPNYPAYISNTGGILKYIDDTADISRAIQVPLILDGAIDKAYYVNTSGVVYKTFSNLSSSPVVVASSSGYIGGYHTNITAYDDSNRFSLLYANNLPTWSGIYSSLGTLQVILNAYDTLHVGLAINRQGTHIAYSFRPNTSSPYNVYVINVTGPTYTPVQLTAELSDTYSAGFSWDGTKVFYNKQVNGVWQIWSCNIDGTGHMNLSNNTFNDFYGDSFLFP
jgi:hypothetical protein